jgi:hypothetical protein
MNAIATWKELNRALAALPKPRPGMVRVYRGQTRRSPALLATGARGRSQPPTIVWGTYGLLLKSMMAMADAIEPEPAPVRSRNPLGWLWPRRRAKPLPKPSLDSIGDLEGVDLLHFLAFGFHAVAQHYGPGSPFLDVTRAPEVAAWFALHHRESFDAVMVPRDPASLLKNPDAMKYETLTRYHRHEGKPGWIYALDVRPWKQEELPGYGDLVELTATRLAPVLRSSLRVERQKAALVSAGALGEMRDLMQFAVAEPIAVAWPMTGAAGIDAATDHYFPEPNQDDWYGALLHMPKAPSYDPAQRSVLARRPIDVSIYVNGQDEAEQRRILNELNEIEDIAHHPQLAGYCVPAAQLPSTWPPDVVARMAASRLGDTTRILAEGPLCTSNVPTQTGVWRIGLLTADIPDEVAVTRPDNGSAPKASLNSVLLQLSPLEYPFWHRVHHSGSPWTLPTAVWLLRDGKRYVLTSFDQRFPGTVVGVKAAACSELKPGRDGLDAWWGTEWRPATNEAMFEIQLVTMLDLLRRLSPHPLESPLLQKPFQHSTVPPPIVDSARDYKRLRLVRVADAKGYDDWHLLRTLDGDEPFTNTSMFLMEAPTTAP